MSADRVPPAGDGGVSGGLESEAASRPVTPEELARVIEQFDARYTAELAELREDLGHPGRSAEAERLAPGAGGVASGPEGHPPMRGPAATTPRAMDGAPGAQASSTRVPRPPAPRPQP